MFAETGLCQDLKLHVTEVPGPILDKTGHPFVAAGPARLGQTDKGRETLWLADVGENIT